MVQNEWVVAAKILGHEPNRQVLCPDCKTGYLHTKDEMWPDGKKCDRYLVCDHCKAYNVMTFNIDKP